MDCEKYTRLVQPTLEQSMAKISQRFATIEGKGAALPASRPARWSTR